MQDEIISQKELGDQVILINESQINVNQNQQQHNSSVDNSMYSCKNSSVVNSKRNSYRGGQGKNPLKEELIEINGELVVEQFDYLQSDLSINNQRFEKLRREKIQKKITMIKEAKNIGKGGGYRDEDMNLLIYGVHATLFYVQIPQFDKIIFYLSEEDEFRLVILNLSSKKFDFLDCEEITKLKEGCCYKIMLPSIELQAEKCLSVQIQEFNFILQFETKENKEKIYQAFYHQLIKNQIQQSISCNLVSFRNLITKGQYNLFQQPKKSILEQDNHKQENILEIFTKIDTEKLIDFETLKKFFTEEIVLISENYLQILFQTVIADEPEFAKKQKINFNLFEKIILKAFYPQYLAQIYEKFSEKLENSPENIKPTKYKYAINQENMGIQDIDKFFCTMQKQKLENEEIQTIVEFLQNQNLFFMGNIYLPQQNIQNKENDNLQVPQKIDSNKNKDPNASEFQLLKNDKNNNIQNKEHSYSFSKQPEMEKSEKKFILTQFRSIKPSQLKISLSNFESIIFSHRNSIFDPKKAQIHQNMDKPFNRYFIKSCKGVYQNIDSYTKLKDENNFQIEEGLFPLQFALLRGYRFLDFEVYDDELSSRPIVIYGVMREKSIDFEKIVRFIVDQGFKQNSFPIVINLELFCGTAAKFILKDILESVLQHHLYKIPYNYQETMHYPALSELEYRVIVCGNLFSVPISEKSEEQSNLGFQKTKKDQKVEKKTEIEEIEKELEELLNEESQSEKVLRKNIKEFFKGNEEKEQKIKLKTFFEDQFMDSELKKEKQDAIRRRSVFAPPIIITTVEQTNNLTKNFDFVNYASNLDSIYTFFLKKVEITTKFFQQPSMWEIYHLNETQILFLQEKIKLAQYDPTDVLEFHKSFFTRTTKNFLSNQYKNIDPVLPINMGVQIIDNYSYTFDLESLIYHSFFYKNGGAKSGYVLNNKIQKSHKYSQQSLADDVQFTNCTNSIQQEDHTYQIDLIMGQNIRFCKSVQTDVEVEIIIVKSPKNLSQLIVREYYKSPVVQFNHINPYFGCQIQTKIEDPDTSFLVFQVINPINKYLLGWYSIPFDCIRPGLRVVPLRDEYFYSIPDSYLLCEIQIKSEQQ